MESKSLSFLTNASIYSRMLHVTATCEHFRECPSYAAPVQHATLFIRERREDVGWGREAFTAAKLLLKAVNKISFYDSAHSDKLPVSVRSSYLAHSLAYSLIQILRCLPTFPSSVPFRHVFCLLLFAAYLCIFYLHASMQSSPGSECH